MNHPAAPPPGPIRLAPPEAALAALLAALPGPVPPRPLPAGEAVGLVLAVPLAAGRAVPEAAVALRDGWAVAAAETLGAGPYAPAPLATPPVRVAAGDLLPPGTDAVLPAFELEDGPLPQAIGTVAPGEGTRRAGEDVAPGTVLRAAGQRLAARDLPAAAALGLAEVAVRWPRIAWIAAGAGIAAEPARDTLRPMLAALAQAAGAAFHPCPPVPPEPGAIADALRGAAAGHDLVLLAGGTGEGPADRSAAGLAQAGRVLAHGLGARPGTTAGCGLVAGRPVVMLPGRAEDALAAWLLLARPVLDALSGLRAAAPRRLRLARKVASTVGLAEIVPLRAGPEGAEPLAVGALPLGALSAADALLLVPPDAEGYEAGTEVPVLSL